MAKRRSAVSRHAPRRLAERRPASVMSENHAAAYLTAREALRRIGQSSRVAYLTSGAVSIDWSPHS